MSVADIEKMAGRLVPASEVVKIAPHIVKLVSNGGAKLLLKGFEGYVCLVSNIQPINGHITVSGQCVVTEDNLLKFEGVLIPDMNFYIVLSEGLINQGVEGTNLYREARKTAKEANKIMRNNAIVLLTLYLLPTRVVIDVKCYYTKVQEVVNEFFLNMLNTGKYTPMLIAKALKKAFEEHGRKLEIVTIERAVTPLPEIFY